MPRNGSGTHERVYDWTDDRDSGINILASRMDTEMDDMATSLSNSIAKDGQTTPTAALPMGGQRHTNVGNATARTDYAAAGQVQDGALVYAVASGSGSAYTLTLAPALTAYAAGQQVQFKANHTSAGAVTLDVNGLGAKTVLAVDGVQLGANDIRSGGVYFVVYDSGADAFILVNTRPAAPRIHLTAHSWSVAAASATQLPTSAITLVEDTSGMWASAASEIRPDGAYTGIHFTLVGMNPTGSGGVAVGVRKNGVTSSGSTTPPSTWEQANDGTLVLSNRTATCAFYDAVASGDYYEIYFAHSGASTMQMVVELYAELIP